MCCDGRGMHSSESRLPGRSLASTLTCCLLSTVGTSTGGTALPLAWVPTASDGVGVGDVGADGRAEELCCLAVLPCELSCRAVLSSWAALVLCLLALLYFAVLCYAADPEGWNEGRL